MDLSLLALGQARQYRDRVIRVHTLVMAVAAAAVVACAARAASGFYLTTGLGIEAAPSVHLVSGDTDRPSRCDEFVNPEFAVIPGCTDPDRSSGAVDAWQSRFGPAKGILATAAVGYRLGDRVRLEVEYLRGAAEYDRRVPIEDPSGVPFTTIFGAELPLAHERIGGVAADALFANVHVAFPNRSRVTPWVGLGAGAAIGRMGYGVIWARSLDPAAIDSATGLSNEAEVRRRLAGTVTTAQATLRDTLTGYQVLGGLEISLTESVSLTVTGRWSRFGRFSAGGEYDLLRSHESGVRIDGSEPVVYTVTTGDLDLAGVSLSLKYRF